MIQNFPPEPVSSASAPPDGAQFSAAAARNRQPILNVLRQTLPTRGMALEIASGTGQHTAWFAQGLPGWTWQPSDAQPDAFDSIRAWCAQAGLRNVRAPVVLDVQAPRWPTEISAHGEPFDALFCANMLHIAPWETCAALMQGAARHLAPQGLLMVYGPFIEREVPTSPGNLEFDASLRQRDPAWGIRPLDDVTHQATQAGLCLRQRVEMPANNLLLVFARTAVEHPTVS